ncbi:hypothetical protein Tco_0624824 [Tanacetum coccineum]|uniref:Uncharacterized protein n=1 Tax=Tanacetum coccineum TaxID=301880 RepID=A0ABQ4WF49_9ASTR
MLGPDLNGKAINETHNRDIKQILRNPTLLLLSEFPDACQLLEGKIVYWSENKQQLVSCLEANLCAGVLKGINFLANGINIDYANIYWEDLIIKLKKKQREKVVPYTRFLSRLIMHKMKEEYGNDEFTIYPTQVFSVNNWALKPNQPEAPCFTDHMLTICKVDKPMVFKAPKTSSKAERVSQGTKPGAEPGYKKLSTSLKQPSVSNKEETKGGSSKGPTSSKTSLSKKRKESSSAMDSNPSQPLVSTLVDTEMHKEDHQPTGGLKSLGSPVNKEPTFSSVMFASGCDASADSTAKADPGLSAPNDSIPQQQDQTRSVSKGLETILTQPTTEKGASSTAIHELDSPEDDPVIVVDDSDEYEEDEEHTTNVETEDTSFPKSSSPMSSQIKELTNQVLILQSQKHKLELEKNKAEAEATLLKTQPSFLNVEQLNELLVKSLPSEFLKILSAHDFSSSLPTELKDLPSKFNELIEEIEGLKTQVHELKIELPKELKYIPTTLEACTKTVTSLTSQVESIQAKLKTLDALPSLLLNVTKALNKFAQVLESTSSKDGDQSVPSVGLADTMHAKGEKDTNQATIS